MLLFSVHNCEKKTQYFCILGKDCIYRGSRRPWLVAGTASLPICFWAHITYTKCHKIPIASGRMTVPLIVLYSSSAFLLLTPGWILASVGCAVPADSVEAHAQKMSH